MLVCFLSLERWPTLTLLLPGLAVIEGDNSNFHLIIQKKQEKLFLRIRVKERETDKQTKGDKLDRTLVTVLSVTALKTDIALGQIHPNDIRPHI